jgi:hypothetical protein
LHSYSLRASQSRAPVQLNQRKSITTLDPALTIAIILKPFKIEFLSKETFPVWYDVLGGIGWKKKSYIAALRCLEKL